MLRLIEIRLPLDHVEADLSAVILAHLGITADDLLGYTVFRRGYDARKKSDIRFVYTVDVNLRQEAIVAARHEKDPQVRPTPDMRYRQVAQAPACFANRPLVIGAGPCGLFATLILAQMGFRPILLERGKAVRERARDTWGFWRQGRLDPESNVQFGEGGAGTFSDGKLYSQIKDPDFRGRKVLEELVAAGAPPEIIYVSKPHIGTFRLVRVVQNMRAAIERLGGEIRFQSRVCDFDIMRTATGQGRVRGITLASGERIAADHVVLAIGHSARDTFRQLHERGVAMAAKPFSLGVRIEHPQNLIDRARFGKFAGHPALGAADYKLVHHCRNGRSVYSFCMCPGGQVVAAASEIGGVVTNGMSQYSRAERNANAALVVGIGPEDFPDAAKNPLAGIEFQRRWEQAAFQAGGENYTAPAQKVEDFLVGRASTALGAVRPSYTPEICLTDLASCLPDYVVAALREAIPAFDRQIHGFALADALLTGVETRTSSPVCIIRASNYQSYNTHGLYPGGEGAGYAGGILSAAVDGIRIAEAVALDLLACVEDDA
jgi:uncharacterized FAD-dependent dehydrogenase